jgi:hypothetical protein
MQACGSKCNINVQLHAVADFGQNEQSFTPLRGWNAAISRLRMGNVRSARRYDE